MSFVENDKYIFTAGNKLCVNRVPYFSKIDFNGKAIFEKDYCDNPNLGYETYSYIMLGYNNSIMKAEFDSQRNFYSPVRPTKIVEDSTNRDFGLCKFNPIGEKIWCSFFTTLDFAPTYGDAVDERAFDVAVYEPDDAVYLFGRGPGVGSLSNFIIARFNATSGTRERVNWYERVGPDECWSGTVDNFGNPIGAGYFVVPGVDTINGMLKLDKNGSFLWEASRDLKALYGKGLGRFRGIEVDLQNNITVAGHWGFGNMTKRAI